MWTSEPGQLKATDLVKLGLSSLQDGDDAPVRDRDFHRVLWNRDARLERPRVVVRHQHDLAIRIDGEGSGTRVEEPVAVIDLKIAVALNCQIERLLCVSQSALRNVGLGCRKFCSG